MLRDPADMNGVIKGSEKYHKKKEFAKEILKKQCNTEIILCYIKKLKQVIMEAKLHMQLLLSKVHPYCLRQIV